MRLAITIAAVAAALSVSASAATLLSNTFADFEIQRFNTQPSEFTGGPREAGVDGDSVIFTSTNSSSVFAYEFAYSLNTNGAWGGGRRGFVGLNAPFGTVTFTFDRPVSGVGGLFNYAPPFTSNGEAIIRVLGEQGGVLETWNLSLDAPIETPDGIDRGAFRGFERSRADIYALEISNAFIVVDNLVWSRDNADAPVPIPAAGWLFGLILSGLGFLRRQRSLTGLNQVH
ncbi:MAG: hypothetical protein AAF830_05405 [Pseudomonadota bacterium]